MLDLYVATTTIRKDKSMIAVDATNEIEMLVKAVSTTSLILTTAYPFKTKFNKTDTGIIKPSINGIKHVIKNNIF